MRRRKLAFFTDDPDGLQARAIMSPDDEPHLILGELLAGYPGVLSAEPLTEDHLNTHVKDLDITASLPDPDRGGYPVPGLGPGRAAGTGEDAGDPATRTGTGPQADSQTATEPGVSATVITKDLARHPKSIGDREAVVLAHEEDIARAASYLEGKLSVLIRCEKILVSHLSEEIAVRAGGMAKFVRLDPNALQERRKGGGGGLLDALPASRHTVLMEALLAAVTAATPDQLVVIPDLDLLAGGNDSSLSGEAREIAEALYEKADRVLLAFTDPSLTIPEVLADRFAVRIAMDILPRQVVTPDHRGCRSAWRWSRRPRPTCSRVRRGGLYKHVAGMNAVRLRHGLQFAASQHKPPADGPEVTPQTRPTFASCSRSCRRSRSRRQARSRCRT